MLRNGVAKPNLFAGGRVQSSHYHLSTRLGDLGQRV